MQKTMSRRSFVKMASVLGGAMLISPSLLNSAMAAPYANIQGLFSSYKLSNGVEIPLFGLSCNKEQASTVAYSSSAASDEIILSALKMGYRHVEVYGTEREAGNALVLSQIPRQDVFITLRLPEVFQKEEDFISAFNESLAKLKVNYVDLLLVDLPQSTARVSRMELALNIWRAAEQLYKEKRVRALGAVDLDAEWMSEFLLECEIRPTVNKITADVFAVSQRLMDVSYHYKMLISASMPSQLEVPVISRATKKYNKTPEQIVLRWSLQKSFITIPQVCTMEQVREYSQLFDFALDPKSMQSISRLSHS